MKVLIKVESNNINQAPISVEMELPDEECVLMVETDFQNQLAKAEDKSQVTRRSIQEILDEDFNKPLYNDWHRENRHRGQLKKAFRKDDETADETDGLDSVPDCSEEEVRSRQYDYEAVCQKVRGLLKPSYADVLIAVVLDGYTPEEYAQKIGETRESIYKRLQRAKKKYRDFF